MASPIKTKSKINTAKKLGVVLSGGGARGAYEAGVIHYIRTALKAPYRHTNFDITCGASVGALNACFLGATAHDLKYQGEELYKLWLKVREGDIYRRDFGAVLQFLGKGTQGIIGGLIKGDGKQKTHLNGFLDTAPFLPFISQLIDWSHIRRNITEGTISAVSVVATNVFTGRVELFIDKSENTQYDGDLISHFGPITPTHAMASGAIPIVFPTVMVDGTAYTDGGLRLNTPLSPAIHLGADSILVIGLNHHAAPGEPIPSHGEKNQIPSLGQVMGRVMNSVFLDRIQYDMDQLERINHLIEWSERNYGDQYLHKMNTFLKKETDGNLSKRGLKKLKVLRIRPSEDIAEIFSECYSRGKDRHLGTFEKIMVRLLDIDPTKGVDFMSYISFMPEYLKRLLDLGYEDAKKQDLQIRELFDSVG